MTSVLLAPDVVSIAVSAALNMTGPARGFVQALSEQSRHRRFLSRP